MKHTKNQINPLLCDPETGLCEVPTGHKTEVSLRANNQTQEKLLKVVYFTDPICSSCWGIEPQLKKMKLEYGDFIEVEYRMGGLLPDWTYNSGGISKPSDVAHHWDEVSGYYDMPIDGNVWLEDPLSSSYPPSIAFKAVQMQDESKALLFLRIIREMVFLEKKNICKWEYLEEAARKVGVDTKQFKIDFEGTAKILFEEDLKLAKQYGVRGFPSMFFIDNHKNQVFVYGSKPYETYESAILKLLPTINKMPYNKSWEALFDKYSSLTAREFSELSEVARAESEAFLDALVERKKLQKFNTKNGAIWKKVE